PDGQYRHVVAYLAETAGLQHVEMPYKLPLIPAEHTLESPSIRRIAIHPGSGGTQKCWPASSFATLIEQLCQQNYPILLLAGPADHERIHELQLLLTHASQMSQLSQSLPTSRSNMITTLIEAPLLHIAQLLQQCRCYIGNDSGITHLSSMLGIPTIALFGPTDPTIWRPVGPGVTVIQEQDLKDIAVETVLKSVLLQHVS
ncbi:MAG: glycosyltransferase family 9 protein, partial [Chloroflexota bacterium]|nr:glycosyltransferase family 9 protein [Chloroflexota bacterium]